MASDELVWQALRLLKEASHMDLVQEGPLEQMWPAREGGKQCGIGCVALLAAMPDKEHRAHGKVARPLRRWAAASVGARVEQGQHACSALPGDGTLRKTQRVQSCKAGGDGCNAQARKDFLATR
ncbi:hypothetical protein NDU88_004908 [Pleurodeles waltl]|uniref:Uncharacterized protein n=1 Tax=Pleurodeles waltl TaxID=8319 RepID=A0AAV7VHK1_PLEWA|nr:hypothetical protein NDU88_004908 [Pleurodeles waltl]